MNTATQEPSNVDRMLDAGAHYGLSKSRRHPTNKKNIFGTKQRNDIFDLEKTEVFLEKAKEFARKLGADRKVLMFVGGKPESHRIIESTAVAIETPYCVGRWIGGTLTNFPEIKKRVALLKKLEADKESGALGKYTKFERLQIDRQIEKLRAMYGGLLGLGDKLPHALFVIDPRREAIAVEEARTKGLPVIALANTDCNLAHVDYPIPANDSAPKSIRFFVSEISTAYQEGLSGPQTPPATKA